MTFIRQFQDLCCQPGAKVLDTLKLAEKKRLDELRIYDLISDGDQPLTFGVYGFYSGDGRCLYVGKNSSQIFVQRIPWHFSLLPYSWMNYFLKRID